MIERYSLPEMSAIWSEEYRFKKWLEVEIAVCEAMAELGKIPPRALEEIKKKAGFEISRIKEIEKTTKHDVIAFLTAVAERVGESSKYIHMGMTSSDVLDTALALQMKEATSLILSCMEKLKEAVAKQARKHKYTLMIGRSHGVHAEPITFGLKMALWYKEIERNIQRVKRAGENISVGKISGAVGTFANIDPRVEEYVCRKLGLKPAEVSTQIIQRDRHAEYMASLAVSASSLEKFATEIRNLQRTEILEVEEMFSRGQKGSSAMPHKRNPITCERISGLARVIRGNALAAMENVSLWHERDISHSSVERIIIPDSTILLHYMLVKFTEIVENLNVYPERMMKNLNLTGGLIFSQRILLALIEKGLLREDAYSLVQRNALEAWEKGKNFKDLIMNDKDIAKYLSEKEIDSLFDFDYHTKNIDYIFKRAGLD
ncbi:MAG TPA: adenylosuccinate lyase [Peptococcaceae bacterium]|nr:MAG: Adenylosuccinate lyase [Clostridia bacterium 41_269]HBT20754.1 adenylosuccinate lyase [Peptococcaceae bacterium]